MTNLVEKSEAQLKQLIREKGSSEALAELHRRSNNQATRFAHKIWK